MAPILSLGTLFLTVLVLAGNAIAVPIATLYPEVIPGTGLPSLSTLGVTSTYLHTMGLNSTISGRASNPALEPRWDPTCDGTFCSASDAVACINYIAAIGDQPCNANFDDEHKAIICTSGSARFEIHQLEPDAMSSCQDVARGGGYIMDHCTQSGLVTGNAAAYGNGDLIADIGFIGSI